MQNFKYTWVLGLTATLLIIIVPIALFASGEAEASNDPWTGVPLRPPHVDHTDLLPGPYETGSDVTRACLECHEEAAQEVMQTAHWTWESEPVLLEGREEPVTIGKKNALNNFCIGIQGNWTGCTRCHAGYGWEDESFDFSAEENVDCLVCHEQTGAYTKSNSGLPSASVDLVSVAQSVATPSRLNCGSCHFNGGGGNAVKHGDLDGSLFYPAASVDVHMGRNDFQCVDCHQAENHQMAGYMISVSTHGDGKELACTNCHAPSAAIHTDERLNAHLDTVACQTCHIPEGAIRQPTKMIWDWSTAGQDLPEDPHEYLKIKGTFVYEQNFIPEYAWFNGRADRYILGDKMDPTQPTVLNMPQGDIGDPQAQIWPFKVHRARQPYDPVYNILLQPKTVGEGGYWTEFDWDLAARLGSEAAGIPYSGQVAFADTTMYWLISHMVVPQEEALQCHDCHGQQGRLDWQALGYYGDPIRWGGRAETIGAQ